MAVAQSVGHWVRFPVQDTFGTLPMYPWAGHTTPIFSYRISGLVPAFMHSLNRLQHRPHDHKRDIAVKKDTTDVQKPGSGSLLSSDWSTRGTPLQLFTERGAYFPKMSNSLEFALTKDTSVFLSPSWCQKMQKNHSCCNTERLLCCLFFFLKSCLRFLTEESVWPPGCNCQPLQPLEERVSLSKPSAHIYCLSSSLWSSHPPADWCWSEFEGRGPPHAGPGSGFSTEGRISLSKCLAGKYVTRLVNDLALYR